MQHRQDSSCFRVIKNKKGGKEGRKEEGSVEGREEGWREGEGRVG